MTSNIPRSLPGACGLLAALGLLLAGCDQCTGSDIVHGTVHDQHGSPLPNVRVEQCLGDGTPCPSTLTDKQGAFTLEVPVDSAASKGQPSCVLRPITLSRTGCTDSTITRNEGTAMTTTELDIGLLTISCP